MKNLEELNKKEIILRMIAERISCTKVEIEVLREKLMKEPMHTTLEWNYLEDGAALELELNFLDQIYSLLEKAPTVEVITSSLRKVVHLHEERLFGTGYCSNSRGTWDCRSTSPGSRQFAIVKANVLQRNRAYVLELINTLES